MKPSNFYIVAFATLVILISGCSKSNPVEPASVTPPVVTPPVITTPTPAIASFTPTKALPNSAVTIVGSNFPVSTINLTVTIGGKQATIYATSEKEIIVGVPADAIPGKIVVVNNGVSAESVTALAIKTGVQSLFLKEPSERIFISPDGIVYTGRGGSGVSKTSADLNIPFTTVFKPDPAVYRDALMALSGIVADRAGNIYASDAGWSYRIWKISPNGVMEPFASNGAVGTTDGKGTDARFYRPLGLTADSKGDMYVGDLGAVRKITLEGVVTTIAGTVNNTGSKDGIGSEAKFGIVNSVALDAKGNIYACDRSYRRIRKIAPNGVVTTIAGNNNQSIVNGLGTAASFYDPSYITVDADGNVFVLDNALTSPFNFQIRMINTAGYVSTFLSGNSMDLAPVNGPLAVATVNYPVGMAFDSHGDLYICNDRTINKITFN